MERIKKILLIVRLAFKNGKSERHMKLRWSMKSLPRQKKKLKIFLKRKKCVKVEEVDDYGDTFRETITGKHVNDMSGDEPVEWKKIEECIPGVMMKTWTMITNHF